MPDQTARPAVCTTPHPVGDDTHCQLYAAPGVDQSSHIIEIEMLAPDRPHTGPDERGCPDCDQPAYDSGCAANGCNGWGCPDCGTGCDLDFLSVDEGGQCAADQGCPEHGHDCEPDDHFEPPTVGGELI